MSKQTWVAFIAGFLFSIGLIVSQMVNPEKIIGFLNVAGQWDPSLALVMVGALSITIPGFWLLKKRAEPVFASGFSWPTATSLDKKLIFGSIVFGVGWGLAGLCPGPAIVGLVSGAVPVIVFVLAMITGMFVSSKLFSSN